MLSWVHSLKIREKALKTAIRGKNTSFELTNQSVEVWKREKDTLRRVLDGCALSPELMRVAPPDRSALHHDMESQDNVSQSRVIIIIHLLSAEEMN